MCKRQHCGVGKLMSACDLTCGPASRLLPNFSRPGPHHNVLPHPAADPTSCLLTDARLLSIATVFGLSIGALVYATASFSGALN
jgi:hypothetical protein